MGRYRGETGAQEAKLATVRLQSNVLLSAFTRDDVLSHASAVLKFTPAHELQRRLSQLLKKRKVAVSLFPGKCELSDILSGNRFRLNDERLALLYRAGIEQHSEMLARYFALSREFELSLLYGNYSACLALLDEVYEVSGYSMWLIQSRILVLSKMGRLDDMNNYHGDCRDGAANGLASFFFNCFVFLATNPLLHSKRVMKSAADELETSGSGEWADLFKLMLLPSPLFSAHRKMSCFSAIQSFPLVDQVRLIEQLAANNFAMGEGNGALDEVVRSISKVRGNMGVASGLDDLAKKYEGEQYSEVLSSIDFGSNQDAIGIIRSVNLVAKSQAIMGISESPASRSPIRDLVASLRGLYCLEGPPTRYLDTIRSLILQFQYLSFGRSLILLMYQVLQNQGEAVERVFAAQRAIYMDSSETAWLKALAEERDPLISHEYLLSDSEIPHHRQVKRRIRKLCKESDASGVRAALESYKAIAPLSRDYCELASSVLSELDEIPALIEICGVALSENQSSHSALPLKRLVDYIEANGISDVNSLLVINAYVRNVSAAKAYLLNETFEEFLAENGVDSPGQLSPGQIGAKKLNVVLKDVCTLDNLDFLSIYQSSSDVRAERIKILDRVLQSGGIKPDQHRDEVEDILLQALVDSAATEISAQKIYVDDQELRRRLVDEVKSLFDLYRASDESPDRNFITVEDVEGSDTQRAALVGDKNTTLQKIYSSVRNSFLFDERFGLDKNLSAEIRHGFFSNLMRSKLIARHLLTEKDAGGEYKENLYWKEVNGILIDSALSDIDQNLRWFSSEFNAALARAEEWMKVTVQPDDARVFQYAIYNDTFLPIKKFADSAQDAENLLDYIISSLWQATDQHLAEMRNRLDAAFRQEIDKLFEELIGRLEAAKGDTSLYELIHSIRLARNEVKEDISVVREWFKRSEVMSGRARNLRELVAISVECYSRVRGIEVQLNFESGGGLIDISLAGQESKSLVLALMNLYENAISHSGLGIKTPISLRARSSPGVAWELSVLNPVTEEVCGALLKGGLLSIQNRISDPASANLVLVEGGSGLRKVINQLLDVSPNCELSIRLEGDAFAASISYGENSTG